MFFEFHRSAGGAAGGSGSSRSRSKQRRNPAQKANDEEEEEDPEEEEARLYDKYWGMFELEERGNSQEVRPASEAEAVVVKSGSLTFSQVLKVFSSLYCALKFGGNFSFSFSFPSRNQYLPPLPPPPTAPVKSATASLMW